MGFFDWLSATAVSFIVAGNTGVGPFLSLFMVGLISKVNPDLLNTDGSVVGSILSSWPAIVGIGALTVMEIIGKCVPVVDEVADSVMAFALPVLSTLGSMSTFGLFNTANSENSDINNRELGVSSGFLVFFQIMVVMAGIVLAFSIHGLKMLVRLIGVGWLTGCLTVLEALWVIVSISIAIFIRPVAIIVGAFVVCGALFSIKRNYLDKDQNTAMGDIPGSPVNASRGVTPDEDDDYVKIEDAHFIDVESSGGMKK